MQKTFYYLLLLIASLSLMGCQEDSKPKIPEIQNTYLPEVNLITVQTGLEPSFQATADVLPLRSTQITADLRGKVESVSVKEGDSVNQGQTLIRLSSPDADSALRSAQNNLQNTQLQLQSTQLAAEESTRVAQASLETAETNYQNIIEQNKARRNQAEETLKSAEVSLELNIAAAETDLNNTIQSVRPAVQDAFNAANKIIGATEAYKYFEEDHRYLLGAGKLDSKPEAERALIEVDQHLKNNDHQTYDQAIALLLETEDALEKTLIVLNNSPTAEVYPQSQLIADINSIHPQLTAIQNQINLLRSRKAALESAKQENHKGSQKLIQAQAAYEETLAQIRANEASAIQSIKSAEANLENAKRSAQLNVASTRTNLSNVHGQYDQALVNQQKGVITSPFDGMVRELPVKNGQEISPGNPLVTIEDQTFLRLVSYLSAADAEKIKPGDMAFIDSINETAAIHSISSSPDPVTKKYKVELIYGGDQLKPGQLITLTFSSGGEQMNRLFIPLNAIHIMAETIFVWQVNENNETVKKEIKVGEIARDSIEVIQGLQPGDRIIDESGRLIDEEGTAVRMIN